MIPQSSPLFLITASAGKVFQVVGWDEESTGPYVIPIGALFGPCRPRIGAKQEVQYFVDYDEAKAAIDTMEAKARQMKRRAVAA